MKIEAVKKSLVKLKPNISWPTFKLPKFKLNIKKPSLNLPELKTFFVKHETCAVFVISAIVPGGWIYGIKFYVCKYNKDNKPPDPFLGNPFDHNQRQDK